MFRCLITNNNNNQVRTFLKKIKTECMKLIKKVLLLLFIYFKKQSKINVSFGKHSRPAIKSF